MTCGFNVRWDNVLQLQIGLITEPLRRDLGVGRVAFAQINLVATQDGLHNRAKPS